MKDAHKLGIVVVVVALLLVAAIGMTTFITTTYAQTSLGEPFFLESGKITSQKELGPDKMEVAYSANGTLKGNVEVTNTGDFVSVSRGNNLTYGQGQGIITTSDGSEKANYTFLGVGNVTQEGKPIFNGASAYSTNSTGQLAFLNNILGIFKVEIDETGNFVSTEWQWK